VTATPPSVGDRFPVEALQGAGIEVAGPTVIYFYPQDDTPTCSREAIALNDHYDEFQSAGVEIVGVSTDDQASHHRFAAECGLRFPLVPDTDAELTGRLGLLRDYGRHGTLADRVTLLLDGDGIVRNVWQVSDVEAHPHEVLAAVRALPAR
jgi:peroxiredoxin Q/BCP